MSVELLYTSAPTGLKQGSRGFCTVLSTSGTPANLATRLEMLSGYRHVFPPQDAQAALNPVVWSHVRVNIAGQSTSILSRVAAYGVDYSGRTNKLAHHLVVPPDEAPAAGPAWLLSQPGLMRTTWDGKCQIPSVGPTIPSGDMPPAVCHRWQTITGDAGWGGVVAESLASPTGKPLWIVFAIEQREQLLGLLMESIALLSPPQRWQATFSTYYTNLPPEIDCKVRCVLEGSEEAKLAGSRGTVIRIAQALPDAPRSAVVGVARKGMQVNATDAVPLSSNVFAPAPRSNLESEFSPPVVATNGLKLERQPPANPGVARAPVGTLRPPNMPRVNAEPNRLVWYTVAASILILSGMSFWAFYASYSTRESYSDKKADSGSNKQVARAEGLVGPAVDEELPKSSESDESEAGIKSQVVEGLEERRASLIGFNKAKNSTSELIGKIQLLERRLAESQHTLSATREAIEPQLNEMSKTIESLESALNQLRTGSLAHDLEASKDPARAVQDFKPDEVLDTVRSLAASLEGMSKSISVPPIGAFNADELREEINAYERTASIDRATLDEIVADHTKAKEQVLGKSFAIELEPEFVSIGSQIADSRKLLNEMDSQLASARTLLNATIERLNATIRQWENFVDRLQSVRKLADTRIIESKELQSTLVTGPIRFVLSLGEKPGVTSQKNAATRELQLVAYSQIRLGSIRGATQFEWSDGVRSLKKQPFEPVDKSFFENDSNGDERQDISRIATLYDPCHFELHVDKLTGRVRIEFRIDETDDRDVVGYDLTKCRKLLANARAVMEATLAIKRWKDFDIGDDGKHVSLMPTFGQTASTMEEYVSLLGRYGEEVERIKVVINGAKADVEKLRSIAEQKSSSRHQPLVSNYTASIRELDSRLKTLGLLGEAISAAMDAVHDLQSGEMGSLGRLTISGAASPVEPLKVFAEKEFDFVLIVPKFQK